MNKRILAAPLALCMFLALAACGTNKAEEPLGSADALSRTPLQPPASTILRW